MALTEKRIRTISKYQGVIVNVRLDSAELPDGSEALREVVEHPGGVTVIPVEDDGTVWCVRQFRYPFAQELLEVPAGKLEHARHLLAIYYLVTGECYHPAVNCERIYVGRWCPALRERYHAEACNGLNYVRAAEGTTDPCLAGILNAMSADAYRWANELMSMLERGLQCEK